MLKEEGFVDRRTEMCDHGNFSGTCHLCQSVSRPESSGGEAIKDLGNHQIIEQILVSGTEAEREVLCKRYGLSQEQLDHFRYFAVLRNSTLSKMEEDLEQRLLKDPQPTPEELALGTYIENIEPQVRAAISTLRQKGYSTWESGFYGIEGEQRISFQEDFLKDFIPSSEFVQALTKKGVVLDVEPSSISFTTQRKSSLEEIEDAWKEIVANLPSFVSLAQPSSLPNAVDFREKHGADF
ncbi:hypothetical protein HYV70_04070 [Candidatus Uhrbacteria bacterium]|nr:hypothetical protein [Candidatus Uhrbacteria bacterium]